MTAVPAQHETPETICQWATATFGDGGTDLHAGVRLMEEVAELVVCVVEFESYDVEPEVLMESPSIREALDRIYPKMREEAADVAIVLARLTQRLMGHTTAVDFGRIRTGSGWHPYARHAAALNMATAKLLKALRETDGVVPPSTGWSPTTREVHAALCDVLGNFHVLTEELRLQDVIDAKMQINRARKWTVIGGHGQHVVGT